jgi:hypothetical protein
VLWEQALQLPRGSVTPAQGQRHQSKGCTAHVDSGQPPVVPTPIRCAPIKTHRYSLFLPISTQSWLADFDRAITHDPKVYHDPSVFRPERFLGSLEHEPEPDPHNVSFGFGRRICPGRVLADSSIYLTVAQSLAVFAISKTVENGKEIEPVVQFSPGIISHPAPYQTSVKPRSPEHEALIRAVEVEHPWEKSDARYL